MTTSNRNIYIDNAEPAAALETFFREITVNPETETIDSGKSSGRITSSPVFALVSSPGYNASAMDGIAVRSSDTVHATERNPLLLTENSDFIYINTGNPMPDEFDSVIMIEDVIGAGDSTVKIISPSHPWQHVRMTGEDIVKSEMILPSKHRIRPVDLGAIISGGNETVEVFRKPRLGIIPTGSEIVNSVSDLEKGKIIDSNSHVFEAMASELGAIPERYPTVGDDYHKLRETIEKAADENDILIINAGSSAGSRDYTSSVIRDLGRVIIHGVAIKPGKPTILGVIKGKPVIGIPGYPVSSFISFREFLVPILQKYTVLSSGEKNEIEAILTRRVSGSLKHIEFIRVSVGKINGIYVATPLSRAAGSTTSLVRAEGIIRIPLNCEGIETGERVRVELLKNIGEIDRTLHSIGSHDLILDIIAERIPLSSSHSGSMGGIMAMIRGECHLAPIHILDHNTGVYNIPAVKEYFRSRKMILIKGVRREQGFIVSKGNPMKIRSVNDLAGDQIIFINRQRGAGTRILLDYELKRNSIEPDSITGYRNEVSTHMAVASAVQSGAAHAGLGIYSAAKALDLDFIKLADEEYDFLVSYDMKESELILNFINYLKSEKFKDSVLPLGGYSCVDSGEVHEI